MPEYKGIIVSHWTIAADSPEEAAATRQQTGAQIQENCATELPISCDAVAGAILPHQSNPQEEAKTPCPTTP